MQYKSLSRQNAAVIVTVIVLWMTVGGMAQAALTLTGPLNLSHGGNLVQNGSFEDHPNGGTSFYYWATGTTSTPFAQPANWVTNGGGLNYAEWGNTAVLGTASAPLPDGTSGLYFGNGLMAAISSTPTFNADGSVVFSSSPTITPKYSPPVTLSQTLTGLNTGTTYGLRFWASGEDATTNVFTHDGFFGLDVTGYSTVYLAAPSGLSALGQSHIYNFTFTPVSSNTTITFTNWGHPNGSMPGWTLPGIATELVLDDVIVNVIPEPSSLSLLGLGALALFYQAVRRPPGHVVI
jgi:hypothetical protein